MVVMGLRAGVYQELVRSPPFLAACIAAEDPLLAFGNLDDLLATLLAGTFCSFAGCGH